MEVLSIATCLVYALGQGCDVSMAREVSVRICEWMQWEPKIRKRKERVHFFEQLCDANLNLEDVRGHI
eukprot:2497990-Amphidinium_carterae.2